MAFDLSRIQGLCFDVDGTLSDTDDQFVRKLASWLTPLSFVFSGRDPLPFARRAVMATEAPGNYLLGVPDRLGVDGAIAALGDSVYRRGLGRSSEPFLLVEGVSEMLARLQSHYPMSIVSARGQHSTERFLDQFELRQFFQCIATAQTCQHTKPYPDPILWAARQMGLPPEACLMIGDTTVDVRAGKAAGAQTTAVLCGFGDEAELRRAGADLILSSTAVLAETLQKC
jgi:phosphoglycolate phosphatase-like HAD superfamily hydrolase